MLPEKHSSENTSTGETGRGSDTEDADEEVGAAREGESDRADDETVRG